MRTIWTLVADAGRARILAKVEGNAEMSIVQEIDNPQGRAHDVDLVTDQPGRFHQQMGSSARSAMDPPTDPHEEKAREFARQLNHLLDAAGERGDYDLLAIVAPGHFLGLLRAGIKPATKRKLALSQANDLTHLTLAELQIHLGKVLRFPHLSAARDD